MHHETWHHLVQVDSLARMRECAGHQGARAIADPAADDRFLNARQRPIRQGAVDRLGYVGRAIDESTIEVEDDQRVGKIQYLLRVRFVDPAEKLISRSW